MICTGCNINIVEYCAQPRNGQLKKTQDKKSLDHVIRNRIPIMIIFDVKRYRGLTVQILGSLDIEPYVF